MQILRSFQAFRSPAVPGRGHRVLRQIDKYAGVPAVLFIGMVRRKRTLPRTIRRIGLLNTAAIGDTVLMSASVEDLRSAYADADIHLLVGPSNYEAARLVSPSSAVVKLPVFEPFSSIMELRRRNLDVLLDFGPWARLNAVFTAFSRAKFTVGFHTSGQHRHYVYDIAVEHSPQLHELENYRRLLSAVNVAGHHRPWITGDRIPPIPDRAWDKPYLVFHPWPGGTAANLKQWPIGRWLKLAEHFAAQGYNIVLTGTASQGLANNDVMSAINPLWRRAVHNQAGLSLAATSAVILGASLLVSVDTGIMHLAAALNVPTVALMGPASRKRWGPIGGSSRVLQSPLTGCGYLNLGFEIPRKPPKCMEAISYDSVCEACEEVLRSGIKRLAGSRA
jgi:heptosyltransferase III